MLGPATTRSLRRCASVALLVAAALPALATNASADDTADGPPKILGSCYVIEADLTSIGQHPWVQVCLPGPTGE